MKKHPYPAEILEIVVHELHQVRDREDDWLSQLALDKAVEIIREMIPEEEQDG